MVGMIFAVIYSIFDNKRYIRTEQENDGMAPPEARLPPAIVGCVAIPIGLFWFAWTTQTSIHWAVSIAAGVPFGFGMVLVFLSVMNYLIDAYTIFAASVLAASSVLRSLFGAAFPLFTSHMYANLGVHWASSIPAFLALACVPFPFLFYKYGDRIRQRCRFAAESLAFMRKMKAAERARAAQEALAEEEEGEPTLTGSISEPAPDQPQRPGAEAEVEAPVYEEIRTPTHQPNTRLSRTSSVASHASHASRASRRFTMYYGNPYNIDRVNTNDEQFTLARTRSPNSQHHSPQ
jgi:hypothetical protein